MIERCLRKGNYCFYESDWGVWDRNNLNYYTDYWNYELIN